MDKIPTKERILYAALDLFSERGYDGVGVDQIAEAVGIKGPSLYRHYKSKADILDALLARLEEHYNENFGQVSDATVFPKTIEQFVSSSIGRVNFTMHDPHIKKVRRLFAMEQFRNEALRTATTKHYLTGLIDLYTVIIKHMIEDGLLVDEDPEILAYELVPMVSMMIHLVDREPEKEVEAMARIKVHFEQFVKVYGRDKYEEKK